jgi:hypothetical protein
MVPANSLPVRYTQRTIDRAVRAICCTPFRLHLFVTLYQTHVALREIAGNSGVTHAYTHSPLPELVTEDHLNWLIQVGVLRREVDGQGITDSFRLTPLGQQLVASWQAAGIAALPTPTLLDRLLNLLTRWLRF